MANEWRNFINKTGSSNKFWKFRYVNDGKSVEKEWGRIGGRTDNQTKPFSLTSQAIRYAEGEVSKKIRKGYTEQTQETLAEETDVAQTIGTRWKIDKVEFVGSAWDSREHQSGQSFTLSDTYIPRHGVYVSLLESWSKERVYMLINKVDAMQFRQASSNNIQVTMGSYHYAESQFVNGIRKMIQNLYKVVEEAGIQFAAVGARVLELDGVSGGPAGELDEETKQAFHAVAVKAGVSDTVIQKFAALGARTLEI
jgi:predicted DNA-binding WGR domain protein